MASRSRRRWIGWGILAIVLAPLLWLGVRAYIAYDALLNAESEVASAKAAITTNNLAALPFVYADMRDETAVAAAMTSDPVWRAAEHVPVIGPNMAAVRQVAATIRSVVVDGIGPLAAQTHDFGYADLRPHAGAVQLARIEALVPAVDAAAKALATASTAANGIDTAHTLGPVTNAVVQFRTLLASASQSAGSAANAVRLIPAALGSDGARDYLVVLLDNASDRAGGGTPVAGVLVRITDGRLEIVRSAPVDSLAAAATAVTLPAGEAAFFGTAVGTSVSTASQTPEFPVTAGVLASAWTATYGDRVDGVVSIDSTGAGYLSSAIGGIRLPSGRTLSKPAVARYLQTELYAPGVDAAERGRAQADVLSGLVSRILAGDGATPGYLSAASHLVSEKRVAAFSSDAALQKVIVSTPIAGVRPAANTPVTSYGVFLNAVTTGPVSPSLAVAAHLDPAPCAARAGDRSRLTVTLTSSDAAALTEEVIVYGPVGFTDRTYTVAGGTVLNTRVGTIDGRPVRAVTVSVRAGGRATVVVDQLAGAASVSPTAAIQTTPRAVPTALTFTPCR